MTLHVLARRRLPPSRPVFVPRVRARWLPSLTADEVEPRVSTLNIFVHELEVLDELGDPLTVRVSTKAFISGSSDRPADTTFRELIADPGTYRRQIFANGRAAGLVAPVFGSCEYHTADGTFDPWIEYATDGGKVTCWYGPAGGAFPAEFRKVFVAYINGDPVFTDTRMRIELRGRESLFNQPFTTTGFDDSAGSIGGVDLEVAGIPGSRRQQIVIGTPGYYEPILTHDTNNVWMLHGNVTDGTLPELFDGGVQLTYGGPIGSGLGGGSFAFSERPDGPAFVQPVTDIRVELRARTTGYYSSPTATKRRWTILDIAERAGVTGLDPSRMPAFSTVFDAGNRLVETQTFKQVLDDIAAFEVASIGFNRLDQFYARRIEPGFMGSSVYTFRDSGSYRDGTAKQLQFAKIPGLEKRVGQVTVRAGATKRSALLSKDVVDADVYDALSRDGWAVSFVGNVTYNSGPPYYRASTIFDTDPNAERAEVEIEGHEFTDQTIMADWAERYLRLHGAKQVGCSFEVPFTRETMALDLLDPVVLQTARFGGAREAIIWSIDAQLKRRAIRFGLWSHREDDAPSSSEISVDMVDDTVGAGGGGAGTGATGQGDAAPQLETFYVPLTDKTTALSVSTPDQDFYAPYDFTLTAVQGGSSTPQASGSVLTINVKANGVGILSTKITTDNGESTSITCATQPVISAPSLNKGDKLTFPIDQVGTGGKGAYVVLIGYQRSSA